MSDGTDVQCSDEKLLKLLNRLRLSAEKGWHRAEKEILLPLICEKFGITPPHAIPEKKNIVVYKRDPDALAERRPLAHERISNPAVLPPDGQTATFRHVLVKKSGIAGLGLFAGEDIPGYVPIIQYVGEIKRESAATIGRHGDVWREQRGLPTYVFSIDDRYVIDSTSKGNIARYANHSCQGNCLVEQHDDKLYIYSRRFIRKGTELTYDYALPYDPNAKDPCNCGTKKCRGSLHLPKPMAPPMEEEVEVTDALFKPDCPSFAKLSACRSRRRTKLVCSSLCGAGSLRLVT
ncbi:Setd1a protein [Aphelenchoides avenae]|nr:Setd1a protein [Aphelenchus avenae]